ncbi:MAG: hypothetical protein K2N52_03985, partial [Clostridia bacterium]|nr:hypothetical protein [Clostridia bacterium]
MNLIGLAIICPILSFAVIGGVIGACKGFTRVKSWGVEFILTGIIAIPVAGLISSKMKSGAAVAGGFISFAVAIFFIGLFMFLFWLFRKLLEKRIEKRKQMSYYSKYIENEQNTVKILSALAAEDMKEYKKLTKHKPKQSGGAWSVLNRVFGALTLAIKGIVIAGIVAAAFLALVDFTRLAHEGGKLYVLLGKLFESGSWLFFKKYLFDFAVIGILMVCIKAGYSSGISSTLWTGVVIFMVIGAGMLAVYFAFKVNDFVTVAHALDNHLADKLSSVSAILQQMKLSTLFVSQSIIALGLFVLMLVPVILIAVFVPKFIDMARSGKIFRSIDGVFGAIALTTVILAVLLIVGAIINSVHDFDFMNVFNAYFDKSGIATYIYDNNILNAMGVL